MKIIATITDDNTPEGWTETHTPPRREGCTQEEATTIMTRMVTRFNDTLRAGELPRRLIQVEVRQHTPQEAAKDGSEDSFRGFALSDNPFNETTEAELHAAWQTGFNLNDEPEEEDA